MARLYVEYDMAHFERKDITLVDMKLYDGRCFEDLEPRRLFPLSGLDKYITLLDNKGKECAIIRDLRTLPKNERNVIEDCLREYYLIPKITAIHSLTEKYGLITIEADTDRGSCKITIRGIVHSMKLLYDNRVLLRDSNDNRYESPDLTKLDRRSISLIESFL